MRTYRIHLHKHDDPRPITDSTNFPELPTNVKLFFTAMTGCMDIPGEITHIRVKENEKARVHFGKEIDDGMKADFNPSDIDGDVTNVRIAPDSGYDFTCEVHIEVEQIEILHPRLPLIQPNKTLNFNADYWLCSITTT